MKRIFHISLYLSIALLASCQQEARPVPESSGQLSSEAVYVPGRTVVKVSEELAQNIDSGDDASEIFPGAKITRTFSHGGKYEARMRKSGLHLWYDIEFDESVPLTKASESLHQIEGVELVENLPVMKVQSATDLFNDTYLSKQWHYYNQGNALSGLQVGCDINVLPAWEKGIKGKDNVIVAVIDSGVDLDHEDLKDNIWTGYDENGNAIHGYDFVYNSYLIDGNDHGTHVAGTIAAVNNNGIGVCGIAGGDAALGIKGAQIMSCQIFSGSNGGNAHEAIVWAANHGAVIAQNSWGYPKEDNPNMNDTPKVLKDAIDYFNQYAGCDENGEQLPDSPMKGGVVIFAAGNEGVAQGYPASYPGCIAVSATTGSFDLAYYSNFGSWVDIAAPGGDVAQRQGIYSTINDNSYDSMQGTSMACPHVSGVAALIVSEFGGPGFTREQLVDRLLKTATDISLPADEMGAGMVNAYAAVARYGENLPLVPAHGKTEELSSSTLVLKYVMPESNDGVECRSMDLLLSTAPFTEYSESLIKYSQSLTKVHPGDTISVTVDGLAYETKYYFSVRSYDAFGNPSALSENVQFTTRGNLPPVIEAVDGTEHSFKQYMTAKLKFNITDPENQLKSVVYENATDHDSFTGEAGKYVLTINAREIPAGTYTSKIVVTDMSGETAECQVKFTVEENVAPAVSAPFENILLGGISKSEKITLSDYFTDADGETLLYDVKVSDQSSVTASILSGVMTVKSVGYGETTVTVTATDAMSKSAQASFKVLVRDGSKAYDLYPNPVTDGKMYVRSSQNETVSVELIGTSGTVVLSSEVVADPFSPALVDLSAVMTGAYKAKVTDKSGKVYTQNIVKL